MSELDWIPHARLRRERRTALFSLSVALAIAAALAAGVVATAHGADREAACWLNGCSGVCIDPRGLVLTAKHCNFPEQVAVEFRSLGVTTTGRKVYSGRFGDDDVVAFQLPEGDYPAAVVASMPPTRGEIVYSFGFPSGRFDVLCGTVIGHAWYTDGTPILATTLPARSGHSGGPLFNLQGELVGLCSTSTTAKAPERMEVPGDSNWIATSRIHAAMEFLHERKSPVALSHVPPVATAATRRLYVFTAVWCGSCQTFAADYSRNIAGLQDWLQTHGVERTQSGRHYFSVEKLPLGWVRPEIARACEVATGTPPRLLPTFWLDGARDSLVGYAGPEKLKSYLAAQIAAGPQETIPATPAPRKQQPFERQSEFQDDDESSQSPPPSTTEDWSDVQIVLLVARQDHGTLFDLGARMAIEPLGNAVRRRILEASQGRIDVELVAERLSPQQFAAVNTAAGMSPSPWNCLVLVRRRELGEIREKLVELMERAFAAVTSQSTRVPIQFVSERLQPDLFAQVQFAVNSPDSIAHSPFSGSWWISTLAAGVGLLKRRFLKLEDA